MSEQLNRKPVKAALIIGLSAFIGFSSIFPLMILTNNPSEWGFALLYFFYFIISGQIFIGLLVSFLIGLVSYLILKLAFKRISSERQLKLTVLFGSAVALIIGFLAFFPAKTFVMEKSFGKERVGTVDTNNDGKPDKWVHNNVYDELMEIDYDTNLDGKPDIWEYYKNDKVYKKEIDTDFDGKPDKTDNYK